MAVFNVFSTLYSNTSQHSSYSTLEDTKTSTDSEANRQGRHTNWKEKVQKGTKRFRAITLYLVQKTDRKKISQNALYAILISLINLRKLEQILIAILPQPC